jgi:hypothetical protein
MQPELLEACKELGIAAGTKEAMAGKILDHFNRERNSTKIPAATSNIVNQSVAVQQPAPLSKPKTPTFNFVQPSSKTIQPEWNLSERIAELDAAIAKKSAELEHLRSADKCALGTYTVLCVLNTKAMHIVYRTATCISPLPCPHACICKQH